MAAKFGVCVDEDHSKLPTIYWLPKLHKRPYKSRFIAYSNTEYNYSLPWSTLDWTGLASQMKLICQGQVVADDGRDIN